MEYLRIRNWNKHQKIAGNRAPYVTIQTSILLDMEYMCLPDRERLCFLLLIVFAGTSSNKIPADLCHIQHLCHFDDQPDVTLLIKYGFLEPWDKEKHSEMLENNEKKLKGQRDRQKKSRDKKKGHSNVTALSQGETETETETETDKEHMYDFEEIWQARPKSKNESKARAKKAYTARIREQIPHADLLAGIIRYADYCTAEGTESRFTKHLATFLGPDEYWKLPYEIMGKVPETLVEVQRFIADNRIELPAHIQDLKPARKYIAAQTGMSL